MKHNDYSSRVTKSYLLVKEFVLDTSLSLTSLELCTGVKMPNISNFKLKVTNQRDEILSCNRPTRSNALVF